MDLEVFAIFDMKLGACQKFFGMASSGVAVRMFGDMAMNPETDIYQHPEDYVLYRLGRFDCENMDFFDIEKVSLANARDFVSKEKVDGENGG